MNGSEANVYACNSGTTSEGNNRYVVVTACDGRDCDDDYDLMYIYASAVDCDLVGSMTFDDKKKFCFARFRE